jgi:hypothetical protein
MRRTEQVRVIAELNEGEMFGGSAAPHSGQLDPVESVAIFISADEEHARTQA